jgi:hypothetical protein
MTPRHSAALVLVAWNLGWFLTLPSGKTVAQFTSEKECKEFVELARAHTAQSSIWKDVAEGRCVVEDDRLAPSSELKRN